MSKQKSASGKTATSLIFGLGAYEHGSGTAAAFYLAKLGGKVIVTDLKTESQLNTKTIRALKRLRNVELVLGKHRVSDVRKADLIVRNPGVPDLPYFKGKVVMNDVAIFLDVLHAKFGKQVSVIGITGTRGKSTTTALIAHLLRSRFGKARVHLGGNIGVSPLLFLNKIKSGDIVVLELSSWLLRDVHQPALTVAVVTNLLRDHMNYYSNMKLYQQDKERIFLGQTEVDYAVVNPADVHVRQMAKRTKAELLWFKPKQVAGAKLRGEHNAMNIGAAWEVAKLFGLNDAQIKSALRKFETLPNRLETIRVYKQRTFVNDTTATTPDATIAALLAYKQKVILIAGGNSKNLSLTALKKLIPSRVKHLLLLPGNATKDFPKGVAVADMPTAVAEAWKLSKPGDIILLSPGVSWLPLMNEFERGKRFVQSVKHLK